MTTTETISWRDLIVTGSEGDVAGTLGWFVGNAPANLDDAKVEGGKVVEWPGFFLSAEGEEADWDTPKADVNWEGFDAALNAARS